MGRRRTDAGLVGPFPPSSDEEEILDLARRYAEAADGRDVAGFVAVFTSDGRLQVSAPGAPDDVVRTYVGPDDLAQVPARLARYERTDHVVGVAEIRVDGPDATGVVHCVAHHVDDGTDKVLTIRYADVYRRTDGGWRIAERTVQVDRSEVGPVSP